MKYNTTQTTLFTVPCTSKSVRLYIKKKKDRKLKCAYFCPYSSVHVTGMYEHYYHIGNAGGKLMLVWDLGSTRGERQPLDHRLYVCFIQSECGKIRTRKNCIWTLHAVFDLWGEKRHFYKYNIFKIISWLLKCVKSRTIVKNDI